MKLISWITSVFPHTVSYEQAPNSIRHRFFRFQQNQTRYRNELFRLEHLETADAFVVRKMIAPHESAAVLNCHARSKSKVYIYDPDVNYFEAEYAPFITKAHMERAKAMLDISTAQLCSQYVAQVLKDYNPYMIPTCVPMRTPKNDYGRGDVIKIGWCGMSHKADDFDLLEPAWEDVFGDKAELVVVSEKPPNISLPHRFVQYHEEIFEKELRDVDFAVSPRRTDNCYNKGHSELKILNWMSIGVPVICSPQPSYEDCIDDWSNGMIARGHTDWAHGFSTLAKDHDFREKMGLRAAITALTRFSDRTVTGMYEDMLDEVLA